jgi:hypothetical protein
MRRVLPWLGLVGDLFSVALWFCRRRNWQVGVAGGSDAMTHREGAGDRSATAEVIEGVGAPEMPTRQLACSNGERKQSR